MGLLDLLTSRFKTQPQGHSWPSTVNWSVPGAAQAQMNQMRKTNPIQAALMDRYLQASDDASQTPTWRLPFAHAAGTGLAAGYEAVKAIPPVGGYDPMDTVAMMFGPQFKRGRPGTADATSPASIGNVMAISRGYEDEATKRLLAMLGVIK